MAVPGKSRSYIGTEIGDKQNHHSTHDPRLTAGTTRIHFPNHLFQIELYPNRAQDASFLWSAAMRLTGEFIVLLAAIDKSLFLNRENLQSRGCKTDTAGLAGESIYCSNDSDRVK